MGRFQKDYFCTFNLRLDFNDGSQLEQLLVPEFIFNTNLGLTYYPRGWGEYLAKQEVINKDAKQTDPDKFIRIVDQSETLALRTRLTQSSPRLTVSGNPQTIHHLKLLERFFTADGLDYRPFESNETLTPTAALSQPDYVFSTYAAAHYVNQCVRINLTTVRNLVDQACNALRLPYYQIDSSTLPNHGVLGRHSYSQMKVFLLEDLNDYIAKLKRVG